MNQEQVRFWETKIFIFPMIFFAVTDRFFVLTKIYVFNNSFFRELYIHSCVDIDVLEEEGRKCRVKAYQPRPSDSNQSTYGTHIYLDRIRVQKYLLPCRERTNTSSRERTSHIQESVPPMWAHATRTLALYEPRLRNSVVSPRFTPRRRFPSAAPLPSCLSYPSFFPPVEHKRHANYQSL